MTAINHALTGAAIGFIVGEPVIALPLALISHYALDVLPHFGSAKPDGKLLRRRAFLYYLILEAVLCVGLVSLLFSFSPANWQIAALCAFLAAAPDLLSFNGYLKLMQSKKWHPNTYSQWARDIQWFERPIGALVEVAWFLGAVVVLAPFILK